MSEMGDYINIAILGTIDTRNGEIHFNEPEVQHMLESCRRRNYPEPQIFTNEFGHKRARCPECHQDFSIRGGYPRHYGRFHKPHPVIERVEVVKKVEATKSKRVKTVDEFVEPAAAAAAWRARAKASHDRIIKRFAKVKVVI